MYKENDKQKAYVWQKNQTTQYNLRIMNATGIPEAIKAATKASGESVSEYIKNALVDRLRREKFFDGDFIPNLNKARHKEKLEKLEKYLEQEKRKLNK